MASQGSNSILTDGTVIQRGDGGSPEAFSTIPGVFSIDPPNEELPEIDVSDLESTAAEFKVGLIDNGVVTIRGTYVPSDTQQDGLMTDRSNKTLRNFRILLTSASSPEETVSFSAYVKQFRIAEIGLGARHEFTAALRISGAVTRA